MDGVRVEAVDTGREIPDRNLRLPTPGGTADVGGVFDGKFVLELTIIMYLAGYPRHRENRENDQKHSLSGKTQGIWKFCQNTEFVLLKL